MPEFINVDGHTQLVIPLQVKPYHHHARHTLIGSILSQKAGTVLYGHYDMEYLLPNGDTLHLIANHDKKTVQLLLFTHDAELIKLLPGARHSSLVADTIAKLNLYRFKAQSYKKPLTLPQQKKIQEANHGIALLTPLLAVERSIPAHEYEQQEELRHKVITIIEECRNNNLLIANNPVVSEGQLGLILYEAFKTAQEYQFNRVYSTSLQDQMDFNHEIQAGKNLIMWDSELHLGNDNEALDDTLRVLCDYYQLAPIKELNNIPANRFEKMLSFLQKLWRDGNKWLESLAIPVRPTHKKEVLTRANGLSITKITPYYALQGLNQKGYASLADLAGQLSTITNALHASSQQEAQKLLEPLPEGHWVVLSNQKQIILRQGNKLQVISYFVQDGVYYPLPKGQDLYTLCQLSKRHLYWPERLQLKLKGFISNIPLFFKNFFKSFRQFISEELHHDFLNHVHKGHELVPEPGKANSSAPPEESNILYEALKNAGFLQNGQSLEEFIKEQLHNSPYIIAQANHPPSPLPYTNPFHRTLSVIRHIAGFFIDASERNPTIGLLAMAAYLYGAGAVLAPTKLAELLTKLHLKGLIAGIEPTQKLAHLMSHGKTSEAISASATYWQGMVAGGNLDKFFISAIDALKNDPAEIAIIACLALSLGYGVTKLIPSLQEEMGEFPYTNYAALGAKSGAALYDTIMHPGEDWLLGTCKWICKNLLNASKITIAPFLEGYRYGYKNGFLNGWKKSYILAKSWMKQMVAGSLDLALALTTIPLLELSTMLIHVPFRGLTNLCRNLLSFLGNFTDVGMLFMQFGTRTTKNNFVADFKFSKLYGFSSPLGHFSEHALLNIGINAVRLLFLPLFQLILNTIILPSTDLLSLIARISLSIINPLSRLGAYGLGFVFKYFGAVWDNTLGSLFTFSAYGLTQACNWLDTQMGIMKQELLSVIQIQRRSLYSWAFAQEDTLNHKVIHDEHYYCDPNHYELLPHSESHCLLNSLLAKSKSSTIEPVPVSLNHFQPLFARTSSQSTEKSLDPSLPVVSI